MKTLLAIVLVILLGWAVTGHIRASQARARADDTRDMLDSVREVMADSMRVRAAREKERERIDREAAVRASRIYDTLRSLRSEIAALEDTTTALTASLDQLAGDTSLSDSTREMLGNASRIFVYQFAACRQGLALADSLQMICETRLASRDTTIADLRITLAERDTLLHAEIALRETYRGLANPGLIERIRRALPLVIGALVVGVGIGIGL